MLYANQLQFFFNIYFMKFHVKWMGVGVRSNALTSTTEPPYVKVRPVGSVAELADARALGARGFIRAGSIPVAPTMKLG